MAVGDRLIPDTAADVNARVNAAIARLQAESEAVVAAGPGTAAHAASQRVVDLLARADARLSLDLSAWAARNGGDRASFTPSSAIAYQTQIRLAMKHAQNVLYREGPAYMAASWRAGANHAMGALTALETAFTGIARTPRIREALTFDPATSLRAGAVLRSYATSVDRYGQAMIGEFEQHMALGFAAGLSQGEMIQLLTGHGGPRGADVSLAAVVRGGQVVRTRTANIPEGLFVQRRYWAQRIVRTESANAYNSARIGRMEQLRTSLPTMRKKILAHFDNRTAMDSVGVHGEIRDLSGPGAYFVDGAGRVYEHPPARPNDRETVIPWLEEWGEVTSTAPLTQGEQQLAGERIRAGQAPFDPQARRAADLRDEGVRMATPPPEVQAMGEVQPRAPRAPAPTPPPAEGGAAGTVRGAPAQAAAPATSATTTPAAPAALVRDGRYSYAGVREWARGMTFATPARVDDPTYRMPKADQERVRRGFQQLVQERLGFQRLQTADRAQEFGLGTPNMISGAWADHSSTSGLIRVRRSVLMGIREELDALAAGTWTADGRRESRSIATLTHETIHHLGPTGSTWGLNRVACGYGVAVEELLTEIQSRRVVADIAAAHAQEVGGRLPAAARTVGFDYARATGGYSEMIDKALEIAQRHQAPGSLIDLTEQLATAAQRCWTSQASMERVRAAAAEYTAGTRTVVTRTGERRFQINPAAPIEVMTDFGARHPGTVYMEEAIRHIGDTLNVPTAKRAAWERDMQAVFRVPPRG